MAFISENDMSENFDSSSALLARLTISAIEKARKDPTCWSDPTIHKALIVTGLNLLVASTELLMSDLDPSC